MEKEEDIFEEAVIFALKAHKGMKRKYKELPFIIHPFESVSIVSTMTTDLEVLAATVLHDTVEDANVTLEDIEKKFEKMQIYFERITADKGDDRYDVVDLRFKDLIVCRNTK